MLGELGLERWSHVFTMVVALVCSTSCEALPSYIAGHVL